MNPAWWPLGADEILWVPVVDGSAPTVSQLVEAVDFIDRAVAAGAGVLIYCGAGIGRAPTAYAAWHVRTTASSPEMVLGELQRARPIASPTREQESRLLEWHRLVSDRRV
jgi:protein-tyrosine phosphatase